jgi:hypothetical protein
VQGPGRENQLSDASKAQANFKAQIIPIRFPQTRLFWIHFIDGKTEVQMMPP